MTECYECAKLAELVAENSQLRVKVDAQRDSNGTCPDGNGTASDDCGQIADMSQMSADCVRSEPEMSEVDTREKLEADVERLIGKIQERIFSGRDAGALRFQLRELLDRQAAITERHWMEIVGASANANVELKRQIDERQARVDELTEQLESAHAKNRALKAHIAKMQEGRHGWHVKGVELQREVDRLTRENVSLARDLGECMAERDNWRYRWHQVRVLMDEPFQCDRATLVDIDGEVVG